MGKYENEEVLVVPRSRLDDLGSFQGLHLDPERYLSDFLQPQHNYFLSRDLAEEDPTHKQLIPYLIFHHGTHILHYTRGKSSGESRLAAKGSIGIGGHINTDDHSSDALLVDTYAQGIDREIHEELQIDGSFTHQVKALLNDDSNEVGQVHLGVVHLVTLDIPNLQSVRSNEDAIANLEFLSLTDLQARREQLETWSQICLDALPQWLEMT